MKFIIVPNPSFYQHHFLVCVYFLSLFAESQELTVLMTENIQPSGSVSKRGKFFLCTVFVPRVQVCVRQCRGWCPMYQTNEFLTAQNSCCLVLGVGDICDVWSYQSHERHCHRLIFLQERRKCTLFMKIN